MAEHISDEIFTQSLKDNNLFESILHKDKDKGGKKGLPSRFLKLDTIFKKGPVEFPDYTAVHSYAEGLWMQHGERANPASGADSASGSWNQSKVVIVISKGEYHPILRNYLARRLAIKQGILVETAKLNDQKTVVVMQYTFPDCRLEAVVSDETNLKLLLFCPVIRLESKDIDPGTLSPTGNNVSQINIPKYQVE